MKEESKEIPTTEFRSRKEWEKWLKGNHSAVLGIWLKFAKKDSGIKTITYEEAIEIALCYGWIDSQKNRWMHNIGCRSFLPEVRKAFGPRSIVLRRKN